MPGDVEAALATFSVEELRELVRDLLRELEERAHGRVVSAIIARAARGGSGWLPAAIPDAQVREILAFADAAQRLGYADPSEVDAHLRRGSGAFLRKDYAIAHRIFGALLPPIGDGEVDLGQHEMVEEVLGADTAECAAQYVVSAYMLAGPTARAEAVRAAIEEVRGLGQFWQPLAELERAAVEPLPGFDAFLPRWRELVASSVAGERASEWETEDERWLREAVLRLEGVDGLARIARASRRADDLRAWCTSLVDARDWKAALAAFEEAAKLVERGDYARAAFLDGAALAAQCLGREDLPARLEKAWRAEPTLLRLRRWLGSSTSKAIFAKRVAAALRACPKGATRQRALLHVLAREFGPAAKLLAIAPGLGSSEREHPGHLLFPLFASLLGGPRAPLLGSAPLPGLGMEIEELEALTADDDEPRLDAPRVEELLAQAGVDAVPRSARAAVLAAMKKAAEERLAGVTREKRRRHYGHAAALVAACLACDRTAAAARWAATLEEQYRRFPALREELDRARRRS